MPLPCLLILPFPWAVKMPPTLLLTTWHMHMYQHLIGSLLFLQLCSWPDILFAALLLSQFCSVPLPCHYAVAWHVLHYLKGTKSFRLHFGGVRREEVLSGMTDVDWVGDRSGWASISGFVWSYGGSPISWSVKKQNCVVLSSTEVEYVVLTWALQEGIWLQNLLWQIGVPVPLPLLIATDNNGALSLVLNNSSHRCVKHIDICYHFIHSHIENGDFNIIHTPGVVNTANIFTKSLGCIKFQEHVAQLGLGACWGGVLGYGMWLSSSAPVDVFLLFFYCLSSCIITLFFDTWMDISELKPLFYFTYLASLHFLVPQPFTFMLRYSSLFFSFHCLLITWSLDSYIFGLGILIHMYIQPFTFTLRLICIRSRISTMASTLLCMSTMEPHWMILSRCSIDDQWT